MLNDADKLCLLPYDRSRLIVPHFHVKQNLLAADSYFRCESGIFSSKSLQESEWIYFKKLFIKILPSVWLKKKQKNLLNPFSEHTHIHMPAQISLMGLHNPDYLIIKTNAD